MMKRIRPTALLLRNTAQPTDALSLATAQPTDARPTDALPPATAHASTRMQQRGISLEQIELVIRYGRSTYDNEATRYVLHDRELRQFRADELAPMSREERERRKRLRSCRGLHVIIAHDTGQVITVWRNSGKVVR